MHPTDPPTAQATPAQLAAVGARLAAMPPAPGLLLPVLLAVQDELGWIPDAALPLVAHHLNLSVAEVHGVASFYPLLRRKPPGAHVIHLCRAEACQANGARALEAHACQRLGTGWGGTSPDGQYTLEQAHCLGNCAMGPSLLLDGELHARVTPQAFDALVGAGPE